MSQEKNYYQKLWRAEKDGGREITMIDIPTYGVFIPFPKGFTSRKLVKMALPPDESGWLFALSLDEITRWPELMSRKYLETLTPESIFMKPFTPDLSCTYYGQLFDLFPKKK